MSKFLDTTITGALVTNGTVDISGTVNISGLTTIDDSAEVNLHSPDVLRQVNED